MSENEIFEPQSVTNLPDISGSLREYLHKKTGCKIVWFDCDDTNRVFSFTFRTPSDNSTGVAHILEHSVLAGSEKFQVKEPFAELLRSSLNTFLNAMTYSDFTTYPVASESVQDLKNLTEVYLDAVLKPLLSETTFQREGWHYEFRDGKLVYSGIVFNEMKGYYADPQVRLWDAISSSLFPDTLYRHDSGGNPRVIPRLTYQQFKAFHEQCYHPSNGVIILYGKDTFKHLAPLLDQYLAQYERQAPLSLTAEQKSFASPQEKVVYYPSSDETGPRSFAVCSWRLPNGDVSDELTRNVLWALLWGHEGAPLLKALTESRLGEAPILSGEQGYLVDHFLVLGMKGVESQNVEAVLALLDATLNEVAKHEFSRDELEAAIARVRFALRNKLNDPGRGMSLYTDAVQRLIRDQSVAPLGQLNAIFDTVATNILNGTISFATMIRELLIEEKHRVSIKLLPSIEEMKRSDQEELEELAAKEAMLTESEKSAIAAVMQELERDATRTDAPEAIAALPQLKVQELDIRNHKVPFAKAGKQAKDRFQISVPTYGVTYYQSIMRLPYTTIEDIRWAKVIASLLFQLSTKRPFEIFGQEMARYTGGVGAGVGIETSPEGSYATLSLSCRALDEYVAEANRLIREGLFDSTFDDIGRISSLLSRQKGSLESQLTSRGMGFVMQRARGQLKGVARLRDELGGINYYFWLKELLEHFSNYKNEFVKRSKNLIALIPTLPMVEGVCGAEIGLDGGQPWKAGGVLPIDTFERVPEAFTIDGDVHYHSLSFDVSALSKQFEGTFDVFEKIASTGYLWNRVRLIGGAYGAAVQYDDLIGSLTTGSFRDPKRDDTIQFFKAIASAANEEVPDQATLERYCIGTIGDIDTPADPSTKIARVLGNFVRGRDQRHLDQVREKVLKVTRADLGVLSEALMSVVSSQPVSIGPASSYDSAWVSIGAPWRTQKLIG